MSDFLNRMNLPPRPTLRRSSCPRARIRALSSRPPKSSRRAWQRSSSWATPTRSTFPALPSSTAQCREARGVRAEVCRAPRQEGRYHRAGSRQVMDATYFGTMMVKMGDADGLVSGACHSTADTLRPALQILKTAPGTKLVSAFFVMCTDTPQFGTDGTLIFADCGLNINPSSDELSEIAIASAHSWSTFMGSVERTWPCSPTPPWLRRGEVAKKVQEAVKFCKEKLPSSPSMATCSSTPPSFPPSPSSRPPAPPLPARPTCLCSPISRPATSATSWSSASPAPTLTAPSCRASPSRLTTFRAAALPTTSWVS